MSFLDNLFGSPNVEKLEAKGDVKGLIKALNYVESMEVRRNAYSALVKIGKPAVEQVIVVLKDDDSDSRQFAANALGEIRDKMAVEPLIAALEDSNWQVIQSAAYALGEIGDKRAAEPLVAALKSHDSNSYVANSAAFALAKIGDNRGIKQLIVALDDNHVDVRKRAFEAIMKIGEPAINPLISAFADQSEFVRKNAAETIVKIGEPAIKPLIVALEDSRFRVCDEAAKALDKIGWKADTSENMVAYWIAKRNIDACVDIGKPAVEPLINAMLKYRWADGVYALARIKDKSAVEPLIAMLKDAMFKYRWSSVVYALGEIGDKRAVEPLIAALYNNDNQVRETAREALDKIGWKADKSENGAAYWVSKLNFDACIDIGKPAVEPLIIALKDIKYDKRSDAASALGKIGDNRAVEPLIEALNDHKRDVRINAAQALVTIYKKGIMDDAHKHLILAQKDKIIEKHYDYVEHILSPCGREFDGDKHVDKGIGVDFPI